MTTLNILPTLLSRLRTPLALLALAAVLPMAWALPIAAAGSLAWRLTWATACVSLLVLGVLWLLKTLLRQQQQFIRCVDSFCRLDAAALGTASAVDSLPAPDADHPYGQSIHTLRETILDYHQRLQEAEHGRASAEVRFLRAAADRERMMEIFSHLPDPVLAVDHFGEVVLINSSARHLFGIVGDPGEEDSLPAGARSLKSLVRCEALVELLQETRRRSTRGRTSEFLIDWPQGQPRWFRAACRPLGSADGGKDKQETGAVAILTDISGERVIQKRNAEFVSAVSHEMKTPLAGIKAYVELLSDGDADDERTRDEFLGVIDSQADRLQRLIDNLLNLARIEAGVVEVHKEPRSLNEVLQEAISVVLPAAEAKRIALECELSPLYLGVLSDRDMLLQAAINLLSNAIKYTAERGKVTLRSRTAEGEVEFEVADSGVGLSPEDQQKVFEKFYRVKKDKDMATGTGLGLPLAKHIVEDVHGGRLTVQSKLGEGSTFRISLPSAARLSS